MTHHSFEKVGTASGVPRNQKVPTRTENGDEYATHHTAKLWKTSHPQAAATVYIPLTDDEDVELAAGVRPTPLAEGRPQGKVQRHAGIGYELVVAHDALVLQMVNQLVDVLQFFDTFLPVAEQVIKVPKVILEDSIPPRTPLRDPQLMAQVVSDHSPCYRRADR